MRRPLLFGKDEKEQSTVDNLYLSIRRPHAKRLSSTDVLAFGKYDIDEQKWAFQCEEPATYRWLHTTFSQPINVVGGQLQINTIEFVTHIRDAIMYRKGLTMQIQEEIED